MEYKFNQDEIRQIEQHTLTIEKVKNQLKILNEGLPEIEIHSPATLKNGIQKFNENFIQNRIKIFEQNQNKYKFIKFVPASGAATRMFKSLITIKNSHDDLNLEQLQKLALINSDYKKVLEIVTQIENFAFSKQLKKKDSKNIIELLKEILDEDGLNFSNLPKGLIDFYETKTNSILPIESHFFEAKSLFASETINLHFTISINHSDIFEKEFSKLKVKNSKLIINYSFQEKSTDTVSIDENGNLLKDEKGKIIFRPGGHGALINNINNLDADFIFIKNIDNISHPIYLNENAKYKKMLGGIAIEIQKFIFEKLNKLENLSINSEFTEFVNEIEETVGIYFSKDFYSKSMEEKKIILHEKLNRPIRIAGMVKNQGEPGGGPFWVIEEDGSKSLQIVEKSQINLSKEKNKEILDKSTHFNPVDLVCSLKNYKGEKFNLLDFVNPNAGIITEKTYNGKPIRVLELPGLWNGAMHNWITIFVEVPSSTFNPVKEVNDLLRPMHQPIK